MQQSNVYGQYRQVQISTASPGKLILLLYEGAIKAQDIIMELNLALDMKAGEISDSLQQIYMYAYRKLVVANLEVDKDGIQEVIGLLENLYEAWEVAVQSTEGSLPGAAPPVPSLSVMG